jgi:membrane protease YdiL (CAAX protease family)
VSPRRGHTPGHAAFFRSRDRVLITGDAVLTVNLNSVHLPQFFVIATYRNSSPVQYVGFFLGLTCGAVILTWLYNRSRGSILLVAVWHGLYNFVSGTQAATGMLAAVVTALVMIQAVVLIVLELRARRRGRPSVLGPA